MILRLDAIAASRNFLISSLCITLGLCMFEQMQN